jgi:hypothetical protein
MKRVLILGIFVLAAVGQEVQHAPTVAQCLADQRLWYSKVEDTSITLPNIDTLSQWSQEMGDCEKVDPENKWKYYNTEEEIHEDERSRMTNFIARHGLWQQFKAEDTAGKR